MFKTIPFISKVVFIHFISYIFCGLIFFNLLNYNELFKMDNVQYFMRETNSIQVLVGPIFQIIRGFILALILLIIKDSIFEKRFAWLWLWAVIAGIGIICTSGPAPASIEGIIYSQLPLEFHLKSLPELLTQTLLFSILVTSKFHLKISENIKQPFIVTIISAILFSFCGIFLAMILKADFMKGATDIGAYVVMLCLLICIFLLTKLFCENKIKSIMYYISCYIALAVFPTVYNYMSGSILKSPLSFIISGLPLIGIWLYMKFIYSKNL